MINLLDLASLIMIGLRLMTGMRRGFYREFTYLLSIALGAAVSWYLYPYVSSFLSTSASRRLTFLGFLGDKTVSDVLSFMVVASIVVTVFSLAHRPLARRMREVIARMEMVWFDRLVGLILGGAEGAAISIAVVLVLFGLFEGGVEPLLEESQAAKLTQRVISLTYPYVGRWFLSIMMDYMRYGPKLSMG
jgi:uncharacterized membrane protein required for colicin V production